jgi:hypothetical protein
MKVRMFADDVFPAEVSHAPPANCKLADAILAPRVLPLPGFRGRLWRPV